MFNLVFKVFGALLPQPALAEGIGPRIPRSARSSGPHSGSLPASILPLLTIAMFGNENVHLCVRFWAKSRPNLTPRPVTAGPAWKMVRSATKLSIGAQLQCSVVAILWSMPETEI